MENRLEEVYALIWRAAKDDSEFDHSEFEERIPRLMVWLRELHAQGKLLGCGGGGFSTHSGGLTLIKASGIEEAEKLSAGSPMNEIGTTDIFIWDVFYADISIKQNESRLV